MSSLLILSGGLDSVTALHYLVKKKIPLKLTLSFIYGSKHNEKEISCALLNSKKFRIPNLQIDIGPIIDNFESNLLKNGTTVLEGYYGDKKMQQMIVPFRNGIMLSVAAGICESKKIDNIIIGTHFGSSEIYPDCSEEFIKYQSKAITLGTLNKVKIKPIFQSLTKSEIVKIGKLSGVNFNDTYSCYKGGKIHCGLCGTCQKRREAFIKAKIKDPTKYSGKKIYF